MYVFLSENEQYPDFDNPHSLIWKHDNLVYGDWTGGPYEDGTYKLSTKLSTTEVRFTIDYVPNLITKKKF